MGKAGFLSFFVVLAEISSGVKEFFRNDGDHDAHGVPAKENGFARGAGSCRPFLQGIFERTAHCIAQLPAPSGTHRAQHLHFSRTIHASAFLKWWVLQSSIPLGSRTRRFMSSELFE